MSMDFSYEVQGSNTFLKVGVSDGREIDTLIVGMLTNNVINGIVPSVYAQIDSEKYLKYNITAKVTLKQFLGGTISKKKLMKVFADILKTLLIVEDYMMDMRNVYLNMDYLFVDVATEDVYAVCVPSEELCWESPDAINFFKNIMFSLQFDSNDNGDYVPNIINYLNTVQMFSPKDFLKHLQAIEKGITTQSVLNTPNNVGAHHENTVNQQAIPNVHSTVFGPVNEQPFPSQQILDQPMPQNSVPVTIAQQPVMSQRQVQQNNISQVGGMNPQQDAIFSNPVIPPVAEKKKGFSLFGHKEDNGATRQEKIKSDKKKAKEPVKPTFAIPGSVQPINGVATPGQNAIRQQDFPTIAPQPEKFTTTQAPSLNVTPQTAPPSPVAMPSNPYSVNYGGGNGKNFGETTTLNVPKYGETTALGVGMQTYEETPKTPSYAYLIRKKNGEKIVLDKPVFRIGKEKSYVDYFVSDNTAVSRSHANIITRNNQYFIIDTNSTNHTFVNGQMISTNTETELSHGAIIMLANEEFVFKAY